MLQWALVHPWMTFFLIAAFLSVLISGAVANICRAVIFCRGVQEGYSPAELAGVLSGSSSTSKDNEKESELNG